MATTDSANLDLKEAVKKSFNLDLKEAVKKSFNSDEDSDLIVTCSGHSFRVNKLILCTQSRFFRNACKKNAFKEGQTGMLDLPDDDPDVVETLLRYLYGFMPADPAMEIPENKYAPDYQARLYVLADKYDVQRVKDHALQQCINSTKEKWKDSRFPDLVENVYEIDAQLDTSLRDTIVAVALVHLTELFASGSKFSEMMVHQGEFGRDMAQKSTTKISELGNIINASFRLLHCSKCPGLFRVEPSKVKRDGPENQMVCFRWGCKRALKIVTEEAMATKFDFSTTAELACNMCKLDFVVIKSRSLTTKLFSKDVKIMHCCPQCKTPSLP